MKSRLLLPRYESEPLRDGALVHLMRGQKIENTIRLGPNMWHVAVIHADGSVDDMGLSQNFLTTVGRDLVAAALGNPTGKDGVFTASSGTSGTPSGGGMTADQYKGWRVFSPVTGLTTAPVYGNIGTNSTTVLTVDGWWIGSSDTMTGTTPASSSGYHIQPSCEARFMGLTADTGAGATSDTTLASEQTATGLVRAKATYAHSASAATYTLANTFSGFTTAGLAIHRGALFTAANTTAGGVIVFEAVLSADATIVTGDSLAVTATNTLSG